MAGKVRGRIERCERIAAHREPPVVTSGDPCHEQRLVAAGAHVPQVEHLETRFAAEIQVSVAQDACGARIARSHQRDRVPANERQLARIVHVVCGDVLSAENKDLTVLAEDPVGRVTDFGRLCTGDRANESQRTIALQMVGYRR
jgi:hypothetical protein